MASAYDDWAQFLSGWSGGSQPATVAPPAATNPATYVTQAGTAAVPGFRNPSNPFDEGRTGARNEGEARGLGFGAESVPWWDYDLGRPRPGSGAVLDAAGFYVLPGGSSGGVGGGGGGGGGNVFDPILSQLKTDLGAAGVADLASRDAGVRRAIGLFGDPNLDLGAASKTLGFDLGGIIDPATQQLAKQSYDSGVGTQARIDKANKDAIRGIRQALAARGALRSGELGHQLGEQQTRYTNAQFDARQALLDMLSGYQKGYLEGERMRQSQYYNALLAGASRAGYGGGGGGAGGGAAGGSRSVPTQFPDLENPYLEGFENFGDYPDALRIATAQNYLSGGDPYDPKRIQGGPQY